MKAIKLFYKAVIKTLAGMEALVLIPALYLFKPEYWISPFLVIGLLGNARSSGYVIFKGGKSTVLISPLAYFSKYRAVILTHEYCHKKLHHDKWMLSSGLVLTYEDEHEADKCVLESINKDLYIETLEWIAKDPLFKWLDDGCGEALLWKRINQLKQD